MAVGKVAGHGAVWTASDLKRKQSEYTYQLTAKDIQEIDAALRSQKDQHRIQVPVFLHYVVRHVMVQLTIAGVKASVAESRLTDPSHRRSHHRTLRCQRWAQSCEH